MEQSKKPVFLIRKYKDILWAVSAIEAANFLVSCVDTLLAGNIVGEDALAAVGLVAPFIILVTFLSSIINSGTIVQYSCHIGACNLKKAQQVFSQGVIMAVLAGGVILAGMLAGKGFFLESLFAEAAVLGYVSDYYGLIVFYLCLDPLSCLLDNVMVAEGGERASSLANIAEIAGNLVLSIAFGFLWGVAGIAGASVFCKLVFLGWVFVWFRVKKNNAAFAWHFDLSECTGIMGKGVVKASTFALSALMAFALNYYVLAVYEENVFVLLAVAERILGLSTFFLGLGMALQPIINTAQGEKDTCALEALSKEACKVMAAIGIVVSLVLMIFAPLLIHTFGIVDEAMLAEGIDVLRLVGATIFGQSLSTLLFVYYYLIGRDKLALWVCALKDMLLPVGLAIGGSLLLGSSYGLWTGLAMAPVLTIGLTMLVVYMAYGKEAVPFLIQPEKGRRSYCYDFAVTPENAVALSQNVVGLLRDKYGDILSNYAGVLAEDILMLIRSKNPPEASLVAECNIVLEEAGFTMIFRYNGVFLDITDQDAALSSLRQYVVDTLMGRTDFKTYLVTTGYNRSIVSFKHK